MTVPQTSIDELIEKLRTFVPRDLSGRSFQSNDVFFRDFENFKMPLISYLADKTEEAVQSVPEGVSEEFLRGHVDGAMSIMILLADLQLIKNNPNDGS